MEDLESSEPWLNLLDQVMYGITLYMYNTIHISTKPLASLVLVRIKVESPRRPLEILHVSEGLAVRICPFVMTKNTPINYIPGPLVRAVLD